MELNIPIKAVKQKPMANMDFIRTFGSKGSGQRSAPGKQAITHTGYTMYVGISTSLI